MLTMNLAVIILFMTTSFRVVHAGACFQPAPEPTQQPINVIDEDYVLSGNYDKIVVLFGEQNVDQECKFIHFYNKLFTKHDVSRDLCKDSLSSTNIYKSKKSIYVHMPTTLLNSNQFTLKNFDLLDKILNTNKNVDYDFIMMKYNCNNLEINADYKADFNFGSDSKLLKTFSIACVNDVLPLDTDGIYDLEQSLRSTTTPIFKTYFIIEENSSVACTKKKCLIYNDWFSSCNRTEFNNVSGKAEAKKCLWQSQKFGFITMQITSKEKLSMLMFYDKQALSKNLNTYDTLITEFYVLLCNAINITMCRDNLNYVGVSNKEISNLVFEFYDLELSVSFHKEQYDFCNYLYTHFFPNSNKLVTQRLSDLCNRLNHVSTVSNKPSFSDGFFNYELFKIYGNCIAWNSYQINKKSSLSVLDETLVNRILSRSSRINKEYLENWRKEVNINDRCTSFDYVRLLYMIYRHQPPIFTKIVSSTVCIFQGDFLSLTSIVDQSRECKSVVLMSKNTVFLDESRTKVINQNVEVELFVFAPRWITLTSFQNLTKIWARIYGAGYEIIDETSTYYTKKLPNNGFELTFGKIEPYKFREHYIIFSKTTNSRVVGSQLNNYNYVDDLMLVVNNRFKIWSNATDIKSSQSDVSDYIISLELIANQNQNLLNPNIYYLYVNIILTYGTLFSSMESQSNIVIDIDRALKNFQDLLDKNMVKIEKKAYVGHINETTENHVKVINARIEESTLIIKNFHEKLDATLKKNENEVKKLVSEIENDVEKKLLENRENLNNKRTDAIARQAAKSIFGVFSFISNVVGIFSHGAAKVLASTVQAVAKAGESGTTFFKKNYDTSYQVPVGAYRKINDFTTDITSSADKEIKSLYSDIIDLKSQLDTSKSQKDKEIVDMLTEIKINVEQTKNSDNENKLTIIIQLKEKFNKIKAPLSRKKRETGHSMLMSDIASDISSKIVRLKRFGRKLLQDTKDEVDYGEVAGAGIEGTADLVGNVDSTIKEISDIDKEIKENNEAIKSIQNFKENIKDKIIPGVAEFSKSFSSSVENLSNISKPLLIEMKFLLQKELKKMKTTMSKISTGFSVFEEVIETGEDLENILLATLELHDDIDKSKKDIEQANFIKNMFTPPVIRDIKDSKINEMIDALKHNVSQIVLNNNFKKILINMKQWSFPFVEHFIPITVLKKTDYLIENPILLSEFFTLVKSNFETYKTNINEKIDETLHIADFYNSSSSSPFYTWHNHKYSNEIDNILSGNKTMLRANFDQSLDAPQNIIKFNSVYLEFSCENETLCEQIKKDLQYFQVELTHLGYSQYRCDNKVYTVYSKSVTISLSFERNAHGEFVHKNKAYEKLKNGDIVLSPYTFWNIELKKSKHSVNWDILEKYMGKVSISLVGSGTYIRDDSCTFCTSRLDVYYEPDYLL